MALSTCTTRIVADPLLTMAHPRRGGHPSTRTTIGYVMNHLHAGRHFTNLATAITTSF